MSTAEWSLQAHAPAIVPAAEAGNKEASAAPYKWILHPVIDLLFCCGGAMWIMFALMRSGLINLPIYDLNDPIGGTALALMGTLLLSDSHNAATLVRLYKDKAAPGSNPLFMYVLPLAFLALAVVAMGNPVVLSVAVQLYLLLIVQHLTAQIYGITLMYCFKRNYRLADGDKKRLQLVLQSTMLFAILRQVSDPLFKRYSFAGVSLLPLPQIPTWTVFLAFGLVVVACALFLMVVARKAIVEKQMFPLPAALLLISGVAIFTLGQPVLGMLWLYVPAFFHASQYLVVTTAINLKEHFLARGVAPEHIAGKILSAENMEYWGMIVALGMTLYLGIPLVCTIFGVPFMTGAAAVFCAVNFHHFIADHVIWRMRDPAVRKLLVQ